MKKFSETLIELIGILDLKDTQVRMKKNMKTHDHSKGIHRKAFSTEL
jgi:hypothetical protein